MNKPSREQKAMMLKAELLNEELNELQERMERLVRDRKEMAQLQEDLGHFAEVEKGDELLVPLTHGVYTKALFSGSHDLLVNIGGDALVPRSLDEVKRMIETQAQRIEELQEEAGKAYDEKLQALQDIERKFQVD